MDARLGFLEGDGRAARLIRERDWSDHPLGPPQGWPEAFRAALSLVLNSSESMILAWGPELRFFFNDTYVPLLGPRVDWAMGARFDEVWADAWDQAKPIIDDAMAGRSRRFVDLPWRLSTDRGQADTWWTFSYSRVLGSDGAPAGLFILTSETTDRVLGEARRREDEARNRQVLDGAVDYAIVATDLEGRVTRWNEGARRILGWTEAEMLGRPVDRFFTPEDRAADRPQVEMRAALECGRGRDVRWHLRASGERFWADGEMTVVRDAEGAAVGFVKVLKDQTPEHQAAVALRESEARLSRAQQAGGVGVFSVELAENRLYGSAEFCRLFGVEQCDGIDPAEVQARVEPEDADGASLFGLDAGGELSPRTEHRIRHRVTGEARVISRRAEVERDGVGAPVRLVGVVQDVTERRLAQEELEDSEARFRALALAAPNHVWSATPDGRVDWANARAYAFSGQDRAAPEGVEWRAPVHPDDRARTSEAWARSVATGQDYETELRLRRADGVHRWHLSRAVALRDKGGAVTGWLGSDTDIDDQKSAAEALQRLNEELEERVAERTQERDRMWRLSRDLFLILDGDGAPRAANPAWERELGYTPEDIPRLRFDTLVHPDDIPLVRARFAELLAGAETVELQCRLRRKDGEYRDTSWTGVATEAGYYCTGRDVTDQRRTEDALRQAQKMEAVGQLTGGLAHDFNNLLAGISGALELTEARLAQGRAGEVGRYITAAQGAARRAAALTHRLLAFSRRQTLDPRPTDVNGLVTGMEDLIRRTVGPAVRVEVVGASGLWPTLVDPPQLENALLNLCINARDAMPEGGRLTIETANKGMDEPAARAHDLAAGQYVALCVTDTGTGMSPDVIAKAFDPFFTTKPIGQGTGLGLSMIYGFAKQSGGQVRIHSEPGRGATLLRVPAAPPGRRGPGRPAGRPLRPRPRSGGRDRAGGGRRAHGAHAGDGGAGGAGLPGHRGGRQRQRPQGPHVRRAPRPAHHRRGPAGGHERAADGRRGAGEPPAPQGAVHHGLRGARGAERRPAGARHGGTHQAVRHRRPGRAHPRHDPPPPRSAGRPDHALGAPAPHLHREGRRPGREPEVQGGEPCVRRVEQQLARHHGPQRHGGRARGEAGGRGRAHGRPRPVRDRQHRRKRRRERHGQRAEPGHQHGGAPGPARRDHDRQRRGDRGGEPGRLEQRRQEPVGVDDPPPAEPRVLGRAQRRVRGQEQQRRRGEGARQPRPASARGPCAPQRRGGQHQLGPPAGGLAGAAHRGGTGSARPARRLISAEVSRAPSWLQPGSANT